jgi:uncharacterized protein
MSTRGPFPDSSDDSDGADPPFNRPRTPRNTTPPPARPQRPINRLWWVLGAVLLAIIVVPSFLVELITDWMWFNSQNLEDVYTTRIWLGVTVFLAAAVVGALLCAVNWIVAWRVVRPGIVYTGQREQIPPSLMRNGIILAVVVAGIFLGFAAAREWATVLLYLNGVPFGSTDPLFQNDVGFYVFDLPFWDFLRGWGFTVLVLATLGSIIIYALGSLPAINRQIIEAQRGKPTDLKLDLDPRIGAHLSVIGAVFLVLIAIGYWLGRFDLLYSSRSVYYGAGYTDVNARLPALYIMLVVAALMAILLLVNMRIRTWRLLAVALGVWVVALIVVGGAYPAVTQEAVVKPNEAQLERPFIQNNIEATRRAFGLDKFRVTDVPAVTAVTPAQIAANPSTVNNIRLWDYRPLRDTYLQLQQIRPYYTFSANEGVDIDRYNINGNLQQVMLSAREMSTADLPERSRTWQNEHFYYTHGYGAVVSKVNSVIGEGLPELLVQNIPPRAAVPELQINQPEIYYGELTNNYVFVNSGRPEFNYPDETTESGARETRYAGAGGVRMSGFLEKALFAIRFGDGRILLSNDVTSDTRVLFHRNIHDSVRLLVPFLSYDGDPYLVIADGKLYWVQDAYTTTDRYPYATPYNGRFNYIRNSVKVVIDAYQGTHTFYVSDPTDPLVQAYRRIFPALFADIGSMPASLREHLRYPEDLMNIQASMYELYHMTSPEAFYAREDQWSVPQGSQSERSAPLEAYYVNMVLPKGTENEFVLILPFTPTRRDNMIAWMAGRSDGENYGQVEVIRYPKQEVVFGPKQIEARIDQDTTISQQITLWSQAGSEVLRGNLLTIPISNTVLYVQPLFLQATASKFPELKRVIVATSSSVGIGEDLRSALEVAFKVRAPVVEGTPPTPQPGQTPVAGGTPGAATPTPGTQPTRAPSLGSASDLTQSAIEHYDLAQDALRRGDWATYGREIDAMKADLDALELLVGTPTAVP